MHLWQRRIFGALALGGSFLGLALGFELMIAPEGSVLAKVLLLPFLALYGWGVWCGMRLIEGAEGALRANRLFWALQIPYFMSPIVGYFFASGALLYITLQPFSANISFLFRFGSQFQYSLLQSDKPFVLGVNVLALTIFLFFTYWLRGDPSNESFKPNPLRGSD